MHGVAPREDLTREQDDVADVQLADFLLCGRRRNGDCASRPSQSFAIDHRRDGHRRVAVEPMPDGAARAVERDAEAPERPAVVSHRHEEARGQAIERADLATDECHAAAKPHRADAQAVDRAHHRRLQTCEPRIGIDVVESPEQLFLRVEVARGAIAADGHTHRAGAATLALRVPDGVEDALADALEIAIGPPEMGQLGRQRGLRVHVLAAAALEQQLDFYALSVPLREVDDRRSGPQIVTAVRAVDGIHGIGSELAPPGRLGHGVADDTGHPDLIGAHRNLQLEGGHASVLADSAFAVGRQIDVLGDDLSGPGPSGSRGPPRPAPASSPHGRRAAGWWRWPR